MGAIDIIEMWFCKERVALGVGYAERSVYVILLILEIRVNFTKKTVRNKWFSFSKC